MIKKKKSILLEYILVILLIYISGNPICRMIYNKLFIFILLILSTIYYINTNKRKVIVNKKIFLVFTILIMSITLTIFVNEVKEYSTYINIILQLTSVFLIANSLEIKSFINKACKVIIVLAAFSLIFYGLQIIKPEIAYIFPKHNGTYQIYSNAFLYNYMLFNDNGTLFLLNRNTGIFWEPGCYQLFLNFALLSYINNEKKISFQSFLVILLLIFTIITTKSTTGYVITIIIILSYSIKYLSAYLSAKNNKKIGILLLSIFVVALGVYFLYKTNYIEKILGTFQKINNEDYMGGNGMIERLSLNKFKFLFTNNIVHLFGISFEKLYSMPDAKIWNSILEDTIALGWIFSIILIIGYIKVSKIYKKKRIVFLITILLGLSAEALFRSVFFAFLAFSGYNSKNERRELNNEKNNVIS